jgi:hypothetical protein
MKDRITGRVCGYVEDRLAEALAEKESLRAECAAHAADKERFDAQRLASLHRQVSRADGRIAVLKHVARIREMEKDGMLDTADVLSVILHAVCVPAPTSAYDANSYAEGQQRAADRVHWYISAL